MIGENRVDGKTFLSFLIPTVWSPKLLRASFSNQVVTNTISALLFPSHVVDNAFFVTSSSYIMVAEDYTIIS
jgi:hypothetical protein